MLISKLKMRKNVISLQNFNYTSELSAVCCISLCIYFYHTIFLLRSLAPLLSYKKEERLYNESGLNTDQIDKRNWHISAIAVSVVHLKENCTKRSHPSCPQQVSETLTTCLIGIIQGRQLQERFTWKWHNKPLGSIHIGI